MFIVSVYISPVPSSTTTTTKIYFVVPLFIWAVINCVCVVYLSQYQAEIINTTPKSQSDIVTVSRTQK